MNPIEKKRKINNFLMQASKKKKRKVNLPRKQKK
jgi:hypothetical protein